MTPIFAILIGVVATLILVAIAIVVVIRSRGTGGEDKRLPKNNGGVDIRSPEHDKCTVPLKMSIDDMLDVDDKNPDVIPHSLGEYLYPKDFVFTCCMCVAITIMLCIVQRRTGWTQMRKCFWSD